MDQCKPLLLGFTFGGLTVSVPVVGWCRLLVSKPELKARLVLVLETQM